MGRRSRKRADEAGLGATRAERDAARRERAERMKSERGDSGVAPAPSPRRPGRVSSSERPPAPWGSFPLSELVILLGIVVVFWGLLSGRAGEERIAAGLVLASLGGGELALREHLSGFRSHSALLAGVATFVVVTVAVLAFGPVQLWAIVAIGGLVFGGSLFGLRRLFKRRSGGLGFR